MNPEDETIAPVEYLRNEMRRIVDNFVDVQCTICGQPFKQPRDSGPPHELDGQCRECCTRRLGEIRIASEAASILSGLPRIVERALTQAGVGQRELAASLERIPSAIAHAVNPAAKIAAIAHEPTLRCGFGLSGGAGCGKTFALVAIFRAALEAKLMERAPEVGRAALVSWLTWVRWPEQVNELRVMSTLEDGLENAERRVRRLAAAEALVIDDLGVERLRGSYEDDWVASQLDALVDQRYNEMRPTWYTTNLSASEVLDRYGSRIFSRLCSENVLIEVSGADLRARRLPAAPILDDPPRRADFPPWRTRQ